MRKFNDIFKQIDNISDWLKEYNKKSGTTGYVIGLSGGVDSTLVANLAVRAVGKENVVGVIMPIYSQPEDMSDAYKVANIIGIDAMAVDLQYSYDAMIETTGLDLGKMERANIRSRLRMTTLYAIAGKQNKLVAGTGNKSEDTIGYFTKYGDGGVDVLPIVEFYKWEVREMAKMFGVPNELVDRGPTAGLWDCQTDEGELGMTYDEIDYILYFLLEAVGDLEIVHPNIKKGLPSKDKIKKIEKMIKVNKHKNEYPPSYRRHL